MKVSCFSTGFMGKTKHKGDRFEADVDINVQNNSGTIYGVYQNIVNYYKTDERRVYILLVLAALIFVVSLVSENAILGELYYRKEPLALSEQLRLVGVGPAYKSEDGITYKDSLASIIEQLHQDGAKVIALDFSVRESDPGFQKLDSVVQAVPGLVFSQHRLFDDNSSRSAPIRFTQTVDLPLPSSIDSNAWVGYGNLQADPAWTMQWMAPLGTASSSAIIPSFALAILSAWHIPERREQRNEFSKWSAVFDSLELKGMNSKQAIERRPIHFFDLNTISSVIKAEDISEREGYFKDKIVLVGIEEEINPGDTVNVYVTPHYGPKKGMFLHAAIVNNLLQKQYLRQAPPSLFWSILVLGFLTGAVFFILPNRSNHAKEHGKRLYVLPLVGLLASVFAYSTIVWIVWGVGDLLLPLRPIWMSLLIGSVIGVFIMSTMVPPPSEPK